MDQLLFRSVLHVYGSYLNGVKRVKQFNKKRYPDQHQMYFHVARRREGSELGRKHDGDTPLDGNEYHRVHADEHRGVSENDVDEAARLSPPEHIVYVHEFQWYDDRTHE